MADGNSSNKTTWKRRHPCRRIAVGMQEIAGKDAGSPRDGSRFMAETSIICFEDFATHEPDPKSGSKLHALQTLPRRINVPETREAFVERPACRRFRFMVPMRGGKTVAAFREACKWPPGFGVRQSSGAFAFTGDSKAPEDLRTPRRCRARAIPDPDIS